MHLPNMSAGPGRHAESSILSSPTEVPLSSSQQLLMNQNTGPAALFLMREQKKSPGCVARPNVDQRCEAMHCHGEGASCTDMSHV